jgi:hypothetical protein
MLLPPCSLRALARAPPPRSESESGSLQAPQCAYRDRSMPLPPHSLRCCGFRAPPCRSTAADCAQTQIMSLPPHWQSLQRLRRLLSGSLRVTGAAA